MPIYRNQIPGAYLENSIVYAVVNYNDAMKKLASETTETLARNEYGEIEITPEMIERCHKTVLGIWGGKDGVIDQGQFEALCARPYASFGGPLFPTVFDKAAALMEGFAHHQVFEDGNKRTGCLAAVSFLNLNDYELDVSNDEMYKFVLGIANNEYGMEETTQFLKDHSSYKENSFEIEEEVSVSPNQEFVGYLVETFKDKHPNTTIEDIEEEIISIAGEISKERVLELESKDQYEAMSHRENIKAYESYTKSLEELKQEQELEIEEERE